MQDLLDTYVKATLEFRIASATAALSRQQLLDIKSKDARKQYDGALSKLRIAHLAMLEAEGNLQYEVDALACDVLGIPRGSRKE